MHKTCLLVVLILSAPLGAEVIDGIAATVDRTVVTISDLDHLVQLELIPRAIDESDDAYRKRMLQLLIERILQRRDIRRFAQIEINNPAVERGMESLIRRHGSREAFEATVREIGMTVAGVRALVVAEVEVQTYIDERFAPLLFVPQEEIESYYEGTWSQQRREQGLGIPPFVEVREQLRDQLRSVQLAIEVDKWTRQLRSHANVDVFVYR